MKTLPFDIRQTGQIVVFIGIQASGKTTFYKEWLAPHGYVHVYLDTLPTLLYHWRSIPQIITKIPMNIIIGAASGIGTGDNQRQ